ncbi:pyruvate kinase [Opitutia bacterium SCGC AG-212-L18]|nr:pyruvate kinase [Opitutae bacterium SCGC AG-212-L18]
MKTPHRHTKIIFTIGPATDSEEVLSSLINSQVDICRLNMAHGNPEWASMIIKKIKQICKALDREIAIMMDIKGPEIRTGEIEGTWQLEKNEFFDLYTEPYDENQNPKNKQNKSVTVNYPGIIDDIHVGNIILIDNGLIQLEVLGKHKNYLHCKVIIPGVLRSNCHINLPGVKINLPSLTEKDKSALAVAIQEQIDFVALSFVREAQDIIELKNFLTEQGSRARIIAKIEDQSGLNNLEEIVKKTDAIMIARGDLGIECPYEKIPIIQHNIINICLTYGKPVIVATHMLESMVTAPIPTRAEVSDISNAIFQMVDCIMLSAETSIGQYPLQCIDVMKKISYEIEADLPLSYNQKFELSLPKNKMLRSAVVLAQELGNAGILVFTRTGRSAQLISSLRATQCPIFVFTNNKTIYRQMRILWGIEPFFLQFFENHNQTIENALDELTKNKSLKKGNYAIILTSVVIKTQSIDTIQLRHLV